MDGEGDCENRRSCPKATFKNNQLVHITLSSRDLTIEDSIKPLQILGETLDGYLSIFQREREKGREREGGRRRLNKGERQP